MQQVMQPSSTLMIPVAIAGELQQQKEYERAHIAWQQHRAELLPCQGVSSGHVDTSAAPRSCSYTRR